MSLTDNLSKAKKIYQQADNTLETKSKFIDKFIEKILSASDEGSFSAREKILFYKELVYMMKGGVALMDAMEILATSGDNFAIKNVAAEIQWYLKQGKSLSYAISRLPKFFDDGDAAIIRTGETSGNLPAVLQSLSEEYAYLKEIKSKYVGAMIYPCALIIISFAAVIYLFAFVLPGIFDMIAGGVSEMPPVTAFLKGMTDFFVNNWKIIIISVFCLILLIVAYSMTEKGKKQLGILLLNLPLIGDMSKSYYLIKWARYMRLMIASGMDYVETFRLLRDILKVPMYQDMIEQVLADISMGKTLYEPLSEWRIIIPSNVSVLIKVGEQTANLEHALSNVIEMYQEELDNSIKNFAKAIEPAILVVVGAVVMLIALGVFGLIFAVMDNVSVG
ncbi:type II secretion system protein F [candidate division SR1 bacterium]|nr:type II secretion system protein F [candidate division SR1 bacterium]